jgi:hypothetical protein
MNKNRNLFIGILVFIGVLGIGYMLLRRPDPTVSINRSVETIVEEYIPQPTERSYEIVELLSPDGIPSIDNPEFYSAEEADAEYDPNEMILGVSINGDTRAYSTSFLDRHEIVNDEVGGRKIAVTW